MISPRPSSTFGFRLTAAFLLALLWVGAANAWVGWRIRPLLANSSLFDLFELERRIDAFGPKDRVSVVVMGNSHALAGLRPPLLAEALGLDHEEVFSLALVGANAREEYLVARGQLQKFPHAKRALIVVDEWLVGQMFAQEAATRYTTGQNLPERWPMLPWHDTVDDHVELLAGTLLPILDQGQQLRSAGLDNPKAFARALWYGTPMPLTPNGANARVRAADYPWGYPPPWDFDGVMNPKAKAGGVGCFRKDCLEDRAELVTAQLDHAAVGFADLEACCHWLEAQGVVPVLVETPVLPALRRQLARAPYNVHEAIYQEARAGFLARTHYQIECSPVDYPRTCFYDFDHLQREGARRYTRWLASHLNK
jgi:hypothetical protein